MLSRSPATSRGWISVHGVRRPVDGSSRATDQPVAALLKDKPTPTDADIDTTITNICRCGTFQQVRQAIHAAAKA